MNNMMPAQGGPVGANGMIGGPMAQMGGRTADLDNGTSRPLPLYAKAHLFVSSLVYLFVHLLIYLLIYLPIYLLIYLLIISSPGMFQVNPRGDQNMGNRSMDIRDRVDVRNGNGNGKQQVCASRRSQQKSEDDLTMI